MRLERYRTAWLRFTMAVYHNAPTARRAALSLVGRHKEEAVKVAEREVETRVAANDLQGALEMDQVRREVLFMLRH